MTGGNHSIRKIRWPKFENANRKITLPSTVAEFVGMIGKVVKHIIRSIDVRRLTPENW